MKTSQEWLAEMGEAAGQDMFVPDASDKKPGWRTEAVITAIQADALKYAAGIASVRENGMHGFSIGRRNLVDRILAAAEELK